MTSVDVADAHSPALALAGFALVQAAWSLENGGDLVPIGITGDDGERNAMRFETSTTPEPPLELYATIASGIDPGQFGVLVFASSGRLPSGEPFHLLNAHIVDADCRLVGTIRQAYQPLKRSRIPRRSVQFSVVGTPERSAELDSPGAREGLLSGVMSHPEGERLFPQLAAFAIVMLDASRGVAPG